jgi:hypothetical protein
MQNQQKRTPPKGGQHQRRNLQSSPENAGPETPSEQRSFTPKTKFQSPYKKPNYLQLTDQTVSFSDAFDAGYHCLSNCYYSPFCYEDIQWPTSMWVVSLHSSLIRSGYHCYEAQKFHSRELRLAIKNCASLIGMTLCCCCCCCFYYSKL